MGSIPRNYDLTKDTKSLPLYKSNVKRRDAKSRDIIEENDIARPRSIMVGQLATFLYLHPKTKVDLEYYDASPVTLFFGTFSTEEGKRVIGWNIHYYPPKIRLQMMAKVLDLFGNLYKDYWDDPVDKKLPRIRYHDLLNRLKAAKLDFGVRMYDPRLMKKIRPIPVSQWKYAVLTEGQFKKQTREAILQYWKKF